MSQRPQRQDRHIGLQAGARCGRQLVAVMQGREPEAHYPGYVAGPTVTGYGKMLSRLRLTVRFDVRPLAVCNVDD